MYDFGYRGGKIRLMKINYYYWASWNFDLTVVLINYIEELLIYISIKKKVSCNVTYQLYAQVLTFKW